MITSVVHSFQERLQFSLDMSSEGDWVSFYRRLWPDAISIVRVDKDSVQQRSGIDRIVILPNGKQITIDEKIREKDYGDILLEEWTVADYDWKNKKLIRGRKIGWTLDPSKTCDFISYAVLSSGVCFLLPYELLRMATAFNLASWKESPDCKYPVPVANEGYTTINIAVPWTILKDQITRQMHRTFAREKIELPQPKLIGNQLTFEWIQK